MLSVSRSVAAVVLALGTTQPTAADLPDWVSKISAKSIAVISDGDFTARSYADGQLAPEAAGHRDLLTVISLDKGETTHRTVEVSNSVTAAPEILALSPDGRIAFVAERLKQRAPGAKTVKELAPGDRLFAIDISRTTSPQIISTANIAAFPESLAVSPDGTRLAVVSNTPDAAYLQIVSLRAGAFGEVRRFNLEALGVRGTASGPRGGVTATNVHWRPNGKVLAVNMDTQDSVAFFKVDEEPAIWGNLVKVGRDPFVGRFTPDGRYYLTSNWGRDFAATSVEGRLPTAPSSISVIRLASLDSGQDARHEITAMVETDRSSEGLAISPDGRLVATVNMRETAFPPTSPRFTKEATVTLLGFDPENGLLEKLADYAFEGVLPEGGSFDASGDHFLATVFHGHQNSGVEAGAGLEVFRVVKAGRPALEKLGRIPLPHGAHHVAVGK